MPGVSDIVAPVVISEIGHPTSSRYKSKRPPEFTQTAAEVVSF
jgi:hypothetical protein